MALIFQLWQQVVYPCLATLPQAPDERGESRQIQWLEPGRSTDRRDWNREKCALGATTGQRIVFPVRCPLRPYQICGECLFPLLLWNATQALLHDLRQRFDAQIVETLPRDAQNLLEHSIAQIAVLLEGSQEFLAPKRQHAR